MVTINRVESFCPDCISIDDRKLLHVNGVMDVEKTDRKSDGIDCTARYAQPRHVAEDLQDLAWLLGAVGDREGTRVGIGVSVELSVQPAARIRRMSENVRNT